MAAISTTLPDSITSEYASCRCRPCLVAVALLFFSLGTLTCEMRWVCVFPLAQRIKYRHL